jgi:hypothetical protein
MLSSFQRTGLKVAGGVAVLLLSFGIGAGSTSAQVVEVEKVVEKPVPGPERVVTKTVEKQVEVTPQACLTFISLADQLFGYASDGMGYASDALHSVATQDIAAITAANAGMDALSPKIQALAAPVNAARTECRGY